MLVITWDTRILSSQQQHHTVKMSTNKIHTTKETFKLSATG
jgi:hypothetical protein